MDRERLIELCLKIEPLSNQVSQREYIEALMDLCTLADPHITLDIGTNSGTSAMSALSAMFMMGKFNFSSYTFDIHMGLYKKTLAQFGEQFQGAGVPTAKMVEIERNFKELDPVEYLSPSGAPVFCFYDIHDLDDRTDTPASPIFIENWIPEMRQAIIAVHDINPCDEFWERPAHWGTVPSADVVRLWTGQWFRGFGEVTHFVNYFNEHQVDPRVIDGTAIIYFAVVDGKPVSA